VPGGNIKDYALAVGKVRYVGEAIVAVVAETRELARDASELVEIEYEPIAAITDARHARDEGVPTIHDDAGGNLMWEGVYEWGDLDAAFAEADKDREDRRAPLPPLQTRTPLETNGAVVEYNRGVGQWTIHTNNQFPGFAAIMMGPAMRTGIDKLRFVTQDIGGGFGKQDHDAPSACCVLPACAQAWPRRQLDRVAHRLPLVHVARQRALVPRGPRSLSRTTARCSGSARRPSTTQARGSGTSRSAA